MRKKLMIQLVSVLGLVLVAVVTTALFAFIILPPSSDTGVVFYQEQTPTEFIPEPGREIPPLDVAEVLEGSQELVKQGQAIYKAQCASCHGAEGLGNGPAGAALNPGPRNFQTNEGWKQGYTITAMFQSLTNPEGLVGMPAFDYLPPKDRFALAHFVQSLGSFDHGPEPEDAVALLNEKYSLAAGGRTPHKVPVSFALRRMLEEVKQAPELRMPGNRAAREGALLVARIVDEPQRIATMLSHVPAWRNDFSLFVRVAQAGAPSNGFSANVALLSERELRTLHRELSRRLPRVP